MRIKVTTLKRKKAIPVKSYRCRAYQKLSEQQVQNRLCDDCKAKYPGTVFRNDLAGLNLSKAQRSVHQNNSHRGFPDWELYEGSGQFNGLVIELKKHGERLILKSDQKQPAIIFYEKLNNGSKIAIREERARKKGEWKDLHTQEQFEMLVKMRERGKAAFFACGIQDAVNLLDAYMEGTLNQKSETNEDYIFKIN